MNLNKVIVALDYDNEISALQLVDLLDKKIEIYKVGLELFLNTGGKIIDSLQKRNKKIFLDLKFHDIPNTVLQACQFAFKQDVMFVDVHIAGGTKMMQQIVALRNKLNSKTKIIGITVLTSFDEKGLQEVFDNKTTILENTERLAKLAFQAKMDGVVCSAFEATDIKSNTNAKFITICPGIRLVNNHNDDQVRVMTPLQASQHHADYLVIGRPINKAKDPLLVVKQIEQELNHEN